jgi:hypothetical protein
MQIGSVPDPLNWDRWAEAEAFLEPARKLGGFENIIDPDEALWAVMEDGELLGCATAWLGDGFVEVKLIGGRDHRRWIPQLDNMIGLAAREAGAKWLQGWGRRGWSKTLGALGWAEIKQDAKSNVYVRTLEQNVNCDSANECQSVRRSAPNFCASC